METGFSNRSFILDVIETFKRFLKSKKTTTEKPTSDAISALFTTTQSNRYLPTSSRSSIFGDNSGKDSKNSLTTKSRFDRPRVTTASPKDACGYSSPCKNGGTCKTLSSGRYYCFCSQDYYGKNCENSTRILYCFIGVNFFSFRIYYDWCS